MRNTVLFAAAVLIVGTYAARYANQMVSKPAPHAAAVQSVVASTAETADSGGSMTLAADRQGHFHVDARIDGERLGFMVDTGASLVVLRASDAAEIGIRPVPNDFTAIVSTANGKIKAAPVKLDRIEIGDEIAVDDVSALVLPDEALPQNLLGVSFLSRLKRYEYNDGRLVLEQ
jgi:aspartyl protease family protein